MQVILFTCCFKVNPDGDNCGQNNGQEINAVVFPTKSNFELLDGSSGLAG